MSRLKAKGWKRYHENKGKQNGYANFRLRARKVTTYREGYYITVKESIPTRYSNPKYVCTQQWSYKNMQSKKTDRMEKRNKQIHSLGGEFNTLLYT